MRMGGVCRRAGWVVVLFAAVGGVRQAESYQQQGYPCTGLKNAGREGSHLSFTEETTRLLHTAGNRSLYASTFTVEMFVRHNQPNSEVTLIGNMNSASSGQNTGWKVSCKDGKCCLKAYLKQIPQTMQSVCTHNTMGSPIAPDEWFHISARYESAGSDVNGPKGRAAIFVNGIKHNAVDWGNPGRGAVNYGMPYAPFAIGGSASSTPSFKGLMDEVRLWNIALTDSQILDTAYETAWSKKEVDGSCVLFMSPYDAQKYTRIASILDLSPLVLYIKDPTAATASNQNIRGQPWINATSVVGISYPTLGLSDVRYIDKPPLLELLPTSRGVLADVYPRLSSSSYNSSVPDDLTVVVSQKELTVLEMRVRDPNYDDVVSVHRTLRFQDDRMRDGCLQEGIGTGNMQECNTGLDRTGWHSFAGVNGYEGPHNEGSDVMNSIVVVAGNPNGKQKLDVDLLLGSDIASRKGTPNDQNTLCRGNNTAEEMQVQFLPDYTDVQSRLNVRLVWSHRADYDWWIPQEGFEYDMVVRSYARYNEMQNVDGVSPSACPVPKEPFLNAVKQNIGTCSKFKLGLHVQFSPEFVNSRNYPMVAQERPLNETVEYPSTAQDSLIAVKDGDSLAVAIGETLEFFVRAQDRNLHDVNVIKAREDPGLPPGHVIATVPGKPDPEYTAGMPSYPARSKLEFPDSSEMSKGVGSNCEGENKYENSKKIDLSPPVYVDRLFRYKPREQHAGGVFRVCLYVKTTNAPAMGLTRYDSSAEISNDLCVRIKVLMPTPHLVLPRGDRDFEAIVGCQLQIPLLLRDAGAVGYNAGNGVSVIPYKYQIVATPDGSRACSSSECGLVEEPLVKGAVDGLPRGMVITQSSNALGGEATLLWVPERGQEFDEGYRICVRGRVQNILPQYTDLYTTPTVAECFVVRVRKCQECVRQGQSLASIARSLKADLLSLYMSNPFLDRPEHILPGTVLSTGPLYTVAEGDFLEALSNRFLVSVDDLMLSNPDVALGNGMLLPGMQMCVRAPVCAITCKYGTDCHLPAAAAH